MSNYVTIVIRMPEDETGKARVEEGMKLLEPYQTAMSLEDEMTVLEMIENHPDFFAGIADDAREKTKEIHAAAEAAI